MSTSWQSTLTEAAAHLQQADPILADIITTHPLPNFQPHTNYYQELVESIVSQQLSVKAADTIFKRFLGLFDDAFPTPEAILQKDVETYRSIGLSRQKATYIRDLAEKIMANEVQFSHLDTLSNDDIIAELTQVKGVGTWTVHMFLIFCMGRLDVLPSGDLGIQNGVQKLYTLPERPTPSDVDELSTSRKWHPYESVAAWYIWRSLNNTPNTPNSLAVEGIALSRYCLNQ